MATCMSVRESCEADQISRKIKPWLTKLCFLLPAPRPSISNTHFHYSPSSFRWLPRENPSNVDAMSGYPTLTSTASHFHRYSWFLVRPCSARDRHGMKLLLLLINAMMYARSFLKKVEFERSMRKISQSIIPIVMAMPLPAGTASII